MIVPLCWTETTARGPRASWMRFPILCANRRVARTPSSSCCRWKSTIWKTRTFCGFSVSSAMFPLVVVAVFQTWCERQRR